MGLLNLLYYQLNSTMWCAENPRELHGNPLPSSNIGVCCAVSLKRIVVPLFFEQTWGGAVGGEAPSESAVITHFFKIFLVALRK